MNIIKEIKETVGRLFSNEGKQVDKSSKDHSQPEYKITGKKRRELEEALRFIGEKNPPEKQALEGLFTARALELQKKHHSSISILKKLRKMKEIKHIYSLY